MTDAYIVTKHVLKSRSKLSGGGIFRKPDARLFVMRAIENGPLVVYAFGILPTKVVLVVGPSVSMRDQATAVFNDGLRRRLNTRYGKTGPVFRRSFSVRPVFGEAEIAAAIDHVHGLPAANGIVERPGEEPWSSKAAYESGAYRGVRVFGQRRSA